MLKSMYYRLKIIMLEYPLQTYFSNNLNDKIKIVFNLIFLGYSRLG